MMMNKPTKLVRSFALFAGQYREATKQMDTIKAEMAGAGYRIESIDRSIKDHSFDTGLPLHGIAVTITVVGVLQS